VTGCLSLDLVSSKAFETRSLRLPALTSLRNSAMGYRYHLCSWHTPLASHGGGTPNKV
jgi:hypothetical protein